MHCIKYLVSIAFFLINLTLMSQVKPIAVSCNPETGLCEIPEISNKTESTTNWNTDKEIIYVGDPMCSWCWGISPQLNALNRYGQQEGIPFNLVMGGLRPGGGDEWNSNFTSFLKHHWEEVNKRSGQPFNFELLDLEYFNYDTEPACRAVVTVRKMAPQKAIYFYELVQNGFYVQSKDPKQVEFYRPICEKLDIDFEVFSQRFASEEMIAATQKDFQQNRQWGVKGFPTVIYRNADQLYMIASGYSDYESMKKTIERIESNH